MRLIRSEMSYLSKFYENTNPLNLFTSGEIALQGNEEERLEQKSVLEGGKLLPAADELFRPAADPERCSRIMLREGDYLVEKYAYKNGEGHVLVENYSGDIVFSPVGNMEQVKFQLSQWVGLSNFISFELNANLPNDELIVFMAIADIRREKELQGYLGQETEEEIPFAEIRQQLEAPKPGNIAGILINSYKFPVPEIGDTKRILDRLAAAKIVDFRKGKTQAGYVLLGQYEDFAKRFLIPQTIVMLETFNLGEGKEIFGVGMLCLWAGMREIITLKLGEGSTEITSVSGFQLLEIMEDFLNCPDVHP